MGSHQKARADPQDQLHPKLQLDIEQGTNDADDKVFFDESITINSQYVNDVNEHEDVICSEDVSEGLHLRWSRISKVVELKDKSEGLLKSSISVRQKGRRRSSLTNLTTAASQDNDDGSSHVIDMKSAELQSSSSSSKVILNEVSGVAAAGEVLVLMGPSGSGKTSLLDTLSGRSSFDSGSLTINGVDASGSRLKQLKRKIAYIKQDDIFFTHLSVRDQFTYMALLRLPSDWNKARKHSEVNRVLNLLRLDKCADTPIRLVSGGERKRVNIGTELLTNPSIVILDEPTSGLDSTSANALLKMITQLARKFGKTVITSIHQPSSAVFQSFDKLLILSDGCVVYYGTPGQSLSYLENQGYPCPPAYNAADHWMDLLVVDSMLGNGGTLHNTKPLRRQGESKHTDTNFSTTDPTEKLSLGDSTNAPDVEKPKFHHRFSSQYKVTRRMSYVSSLLRQSRATASSSAIPRSRLIRAWDNDAFSAGIDRENEMIMQSMDQESGDLDNIFGNERKFNSTWFLQYKVLTHRSSKNSRSAIFTTLNLIKSCALGLVSGFMWIQMPYTEKTVDDRSSYFFFTVTYWVFDAIFASLHTFPSEQRVVAKERASGSYHFSAYFLAKTTSELPVRLALPTIYMIISFWMSAANNRFWVFLVCTCCTLMGCMAGESLGLLVCSIVMVPDKSMIVALLIALTLMISGGFYVENIPSFVSWIPFLSPFKYAYDASLQVAFDRDVPCDGSGDLEVMCANSSTAYASREDVLEYLNVQGSVGFNIGLLFIVFLAPRYCAYLVLKNRKSKER